MSERERTIRCARRGGAAPDGARRPGHLAGRAAPALTAILAAALLLPAAGCQKGSQPPPANKKAEPPVPSFDKVWSAEEIAADPAGYMRWAERRIETQVADRQKRLQQLSARLADVKLRQEKFQTNMQEVENLQTRMKTAVRRAEDEDRWPLVLAGQSFDQARAKAVVEQTGKWLEQRRPLEQAYEQAAQRLGQAEAALRKDIEGLHTLKEKLALDLERVRLSQGMEELGKLRQREEEIAGFAKALTSMADEASLSNLPPDDKGTEKVDIESFLKR